MADDNAPKPPGFGMVVLAAAGTAFGVWFSSRFTSNTARLARQHADVMRVVRSRTRKAAHRQGRHPNVGLLSRKK
jgi:hypothetical protein